MLAKYLRCESETGTRPAYQISRHARRLSVTDHALHGWKRASQRALDLVDILVNLDHAHRRRGAAMKIHDFTGVGIANPDIVDVMDRAIGGKARQRCPDSFDAVGRGIDAQRQFRFQRFDMGVDLDILAEFFTYVAFQLMGDVVGRCKGHIAVDFKVDADGELAAKIVHRDMMDSETGIAGDHHNAFAYTLVVARDRHGGKGQVGLIKRFVDRFLRLSFDLVDAVDRV